MVMRGRSVWAARKLNVSSTQGFGHFSLFTSRQQIKRISHTFPQSGSSSFKDPAVKRFLKEVDCNIETAL